VADDEAGGSKLRGPLERLIPLQDIIILFDQFSVITFDHALFIKELEEGRVFGAFYEVNALLVVNKLDLFPLDIFFLVLFLLHSEHVVVEVLLEFFVCVVDAELLEGVFLEDFEPKDV